MKSVIAANNFAHVNSNYLDRIRDEGLNKKTWINGLKKSTNDIKKKKKTGNISVITLHEKKTGNQSTRPKGEL